VHRRAQGFFESAIAAGADAYITGEISEPQMHLAREMGVSFIAAGHHATERYGAPAVAAHVPRSAGWSTASSISTTRPDPSSDLRLS
jgi:putative NIF3 family GTP cyclohydrolase 1 type 2